MSHTPTDLARKLRQYCDTQDYYDPDNAEYRRFLRDAADLIERPSTPKPDCKHRWAHKLDGKTVQCVLCGMVETPAPDADAILRLLDACIFEPARTPLYYELRAAVEQIVRERDDNETECEIHAACTRLQKERAERAERELAACIQSKMRASPRADLLDEARAERDEARAPDADAPYGIAPLDGTPTRGEFVPGEFAAVAVERLVRERYEATAQMQREKLDILERAERAEREAAEYKRDAERYRWLAENAIIETDRWRHDGRDPASTKHPLDAAIDAARDGNT